MNELIGLVEDYLACVDEEMEHGCYEVTDVPPYGEEETYYEDHERIVDETVDARLKLEACLRNLKRVA